MRGIIGNTVGTPMPRTNYNQTNPKKADYLVGRENILGKDELTSATEEALRQAKESGEFDGADGVSCTHSWNGTTLTVTSASGTSSADLKGEKGDPGEGASGGVIITWSEYVCDIKSGTITASNITLPAGLTYSQLLEAVTNGNVKLETSDGDYCYSTLHLSQFLDFSSMMGFVTLLFEGIIDTTLYYVSVQISLSKMLCSSASLQRRGFYVYKLTNTSTNPSVTIQPNNFYCFTASAVTSLTIMLGSGTSYSTDSVLEYRFRFTSGSTPTTLSLPSTVIGAFVPEANKTYEVSIIDNYLSYKSWSAN